MAASASLPLVVSRFVPALILGLFFYTAYLIMTTRYEPESPMKSMRSWQEAAVPYGIPVEEGKSKQVQKFDPRMQLYGAFEKAGIPPAPRFDAPMGTETGGLIYNAQPFWEMNQQRGGHHTGDDLNGIGGENTDLNDPVYSVANGLVVYAGEPSSGWGNVVIIAHRVGDGEVIHSMYAHLHEIAAWSGKVVARGDLIGRVGTGNGNYLAHLHFEVFRGDGVSLKNGYSMIPYDRIDPEGTVRDLRHAPAEMLNPSVFALIQQQSKSGELPEMDAESAMDLQEFFQRAAERDERVKAGTR